jgi:hypothetical protein
MDLTLTQPLPSRERRSKIVFSLIQGDRAASPLGGIKGEERGNWQIALTDIFYYYKEMDSHHPHPTSPIKGEEKQILIAIYV